MSLQVGLREIGHSSGNLQASEISKIHLFGSNLRFYCCWKARNSLPKARRPVFSIPRAQHHPAPSMPPRPKKRGTRSRNRNRYGPPKPSSKDTEDQAVEVEGEISSVLAGTMFRVKLASGHEVLAHISGKMRKRFIRLVVGDRVKMEMSPYDLTKARIVFRMS